MKPKKVPQRTCIGCREVTPKKMLIRIVRTPDQRIIVDPTGKANGRGAYICPRPECLDAALKSNRLSRALEATLSPEDIKRIKDELEALIEASSDRM